MLHKRELALLLIAFWSAGQLPLEVLFLVMHLLMDPLQTGEDLEEAPPKHHDILDCLGRGYSFEELAQVPAVCILQNQGVRAMLLQRSVKLDDVGRWARAKPPQRTTLVLVGGFMPLVVIDFEDESALDGMALFISDLSH